MNVFKELRKEKGLTQVQLANLLNLDQTTISKWELNKALPDVNTLCKLSSLFDVSTDYLLGLSYLYYPEHSSNDNDNYSNEEKELIEDYRQLNFYKQELIKTSIKAMLSAEATESKQKKNKS